MTLPEETHCSTLKISVSNDVGMTTLCSKIKLVVQRIRETKNLLMYVVLFFSELKRKKIRHQG